MAATTWQSIDAFLTSKGVKFGAPTLGQTTGGVHVDGSAHYEGRARDYGNANSNVAAVTQALVAYAQGETAAIVELFDGADNVFYKNGVAFTPSAALKTEHMNHVHVALRPGVELQDSATLDSQGYSVAGEPVSLSGTASNLGNALDFIKSPEFAERLVKVLIGVALLVFGLRGLL